MSVMLHHHKDSKVLEKERGKILPEDGLKRKIEDSVARNCAGKKKVKLHNAESKLREAEKNHGPDSNNIKRLKMKVSHFEEKPQQY